MKVTYMVNNEPVRVALDEHTYTFIQTVPNCDFCKKESDSNNPALYDCVTNYGFWANVCSSHFVSDTPQLLGLGRGQRLLY